MVSLYCKAKPTHLVDVHLCYVMYVIIVHVEIMVVPPAALCARDLKVRLHPVVVYVAVDFLYAGA